MNKKSKKNEKKWTKEDVLKAIESKNEDIGVKVQVDAFFKNVLEKKFILEKKSNVKRGEYIVKFKKLEGYAKEEGFYCKDGFLRVIISNKEGSKNEGYTAKIDPAKNSFYTKLQLLVTVLNRNKDNFNNATIGYELPTSTRNRVEAAKAAKELFDTIIPTKKTKKNTKKNNKK